MPIAITRRHLVAGFATAITSPLAALAQGARKIPHIGVLLAGTPDSFSLRAKALIEGLEALGYVDGNSTGSGEKTGPRSSPSSPLRWSRLNLT